MGKTKQQSKRKDGKLKITGNKIGKITSHGAAGKLHKVTKRLVASMLNLKEYKEQNK